MPSAHHDCRPHAQVAHSSGSSTTLTGGRVVVNRSRLWRAKWVMSWAAAACGVGWHWHPLAGLHASTWPSVSCSTAQEEPQRVRQRRSSILARGWCSAGQGRPVGVGDGQDAGRQGSAEDSADSSQLAARLEPPRPRASTRRTCRCSSSPSAPSSMPSPLLEVGGGAEPPRTAGTLVRPLGAAPHSSLPKPMRSLLMSASLRASSTRKAAAGAGPGSGVSTSSDSALALPLPDGSSSSSTSASSAVPPWSTKVPRSVISRRHGGQRYAGSSAQPPAASPMSVGASASAASEKVPSAAAARGAAAGQALLNAGRGSCG
mmetsp:Transcript_11377/g.30362  ORF Transcript_11377/g.30362 Transcript_11377/m.30362 type:complete len:317 (+) Transcript_11377:64-1014(+)